MLPTKYGSFMKRFVAHFIDVMLASVIAAIIVFPLGLLTAGTGVLAGLSLHNFNSHFFIDPEGFVRAALAGLSVERVRMCLGAAPATAPTCSLCWEEWSVSRRLSE